MAEEKKLIRRRYLFTGGVQGVGFRYRAAHAADMLRVCGWVHNCWDGSVEMEAQGTETELAELIRVIREGRYIEIEDMKVKEIPVEKDCRSFRVRHY